MGLVASKIAESDVSADIKALIGDVDLSGFSSYTMLTADDASSLELSNALSFFVKGEVVYNAASRRFEIYIDDKPAGFVDENNFDTLKSVIVEISLPGQSDGKELKFSSEHAREVYERCEAGRRKANKKRDSGSGEDFELSNIISAIATTHNSLNLINIWGLTPYQLYNQFARVDRKVQLDAYGLKWAAWGSDPFDFDSWRKSISHKGD